MRGRRFLKPSVALLVALGAVACQRSYYCEAVPGPGLGATSECYPQALCTQTDTFPVSSGGVAWFSTHTGTTGRLDVTVDWIDPASPIGVYLTASFCSPEQFNAGTCNLLIRSETGPKPRNISVANLAAGYYQLLIQNLADHGESVTVSAVFRGGECRP
jgi:hypothetical protein